MGRCERLRGLRMGKVWTGGIVCGLRGRGEDWAWRCRGRGDHRRFWRALLFAFLSAAVASGGSPGLLVSMLVYRQLAFEQARLRKESWKSRLLKVYSEHETCEAELTLAVDESWTLAPSVSQCRVPKWADGVSIY